MAAIASAITVTMDGVSFRHASAPAFIAMKIAAFNDRGGGDARGSQDIEDIIALIASRPAVTSEIDAAAGNVRSKLRGFAARLLASGIAEEVISAQLNNADDPASAVASTLERMSDIAALT